MNKFWFKIPIWLLFALCLNPLLPSFAGTDDGEFGVDDGGASIIPFGNFVPIFMPDLDQHRGRGVVQLPPINLPPMLPVVLAPLAKQEHTQIPLGQKKQSLDDGNGVSAASFVDDAEYSSSDDLENSDLHSSKSFDSVDRMPYPSFLPEGDQDQGRGLVQDPSDQCARRSFPHRLEDPKVDEKFGRQVITLDGGSPDNPYQVCDHGLFYLGALIGVSFVEPHSMVQFNLLSKWKFTKSNSAHRRANNYDEGVGKAWAKYPKKVEDFDAWEPGDWMRRNGSFSLAVYGGVSYFSPDARVGAMTELVKSIHFQKLGPDQIRVSITREAGAGLIARAQLMPFQKLEAKNVGHLEQARVYLYDISKEDQREALDTLVRKNVLRAGSEAYEAAKNDDATLLTSRLIKRNTSTTTPLQGGIPVIARARMTWRVDRYRTAITTHRGDTKYNFTAKAYTKQKTYRHKNFKKHSGSHKGKKWKHFMDKHQYYSQGAQGGVVKPARRKEIDEPLRLILENDGLQQFPGSETSDQDKYLTELKRRNQRYIQMQLSFTNDRVKAKKVNEYIKEFLRKIGVNDYLVDVGYEKKALIGYAELRWDMRVGPNAINQIAREAVANKHLFTQTANDLIDDYFAEKDGVKNDPHNICRSRIKNTELCIRLVRHRTQKTLLYIAESLQSLEKVSIAKSSRKTAKKLAKIAKKLSTNQFVLQAFIIKLPRNIDGYGRLQIFGERFLGREFNTDPGQNMRAVNSFTSPWSDVLAEEGQEDENPDLHDYGNVNPDDLDDGSIADEFEFDWDRINNRDAINEL